MALTDLTKAAVDSAIREFDDLGEDGFLSKYGFGPSRRYVLEHKGKLYASKAIAGAAHGYLPGRHPLRSEDFSGGDATVRPVLEGLGFVVRKSPYEFGAVDAPRRQRNPTWSRDELIIALDLYMTNPVSPPGKTSDVIHRASQVISMLARSSGAVESETLRNPNGVYMKMMNFRRFDPRFAKQGGGLSKGGKDEELVWNEFHADLPRLSQTAAVIRAFVETGGDAIKGDLDDDLLDVEEAEEGAILSRVHRVRERSRALVEKKKRQVLATGQRLVCEVCAFDFGRCYGAHGDGYIEVHHKVPLSEVQPGQRTRLEDLALVCANCHRMIHAKKRWLTIAELTALFQPMARP